MIDLAGLCPADGLAELLKEQDLVSKYTLAQYKPTKSTCNESEVGNVLDREFDQVQELKVFLDDLTCVRVDQKWHYICILVDLYNRKIIVNLKHFIQIVAMSLKTISSMMLWMLLELNDL